MRRSAALAGFALLSFAVPVARADDVSYTRLERWAMRAPLPRVPPEHSAARAGNPLSVKPHAVPSVTRFDHGGYVGGARVCGNNLCASGPGSATGPIYDGTFATDFGGFRAHLGRVFLAPSADPSRGEPIYKRYNADGPRVLDVFALRPLRKAVLEAREDAEHRKHGVEGHGAGGHGSEGHAPEGGEKGDH